MAYKIVITEITSEEDVVKGDWCIVDKRPYTMDELNAMGYPEEFKNELKEVRGYAPEKVEVISIEKKIYEQTVDELDMEDVIKAINFIK